jgi:peptidyl-prolyl cis-trans isomerase D
MIRFLQSKDNRFVKALFVVIIAAASVSMVVYLIPGLTGMGSGAADTYATIYPHWYSRFLSSGQSVSQEKVSQVARQQLQRQRLPDSPFIVSYFEQQAGAQLVREQ